MGGGGLSSLFVREDGLKMLKRKKWHILRNPKGFTRNYGSIVVLKLVNIIQTIIKVMNLLLIRSETETLTRFCFGSKVINLYLVLYADKLNVSQVANNELL